MNKPLVISIYISISILVTVNAQDFSSLPRLLPSYSEDFSDYHSYPSICFSKVFFDLNGKMWVLPCGVLRNMDAIHLFQFDGYDFKFVGGDWEKLYKRSRFAGIYQKNQLMGLVRSNEISQLFFFDLHEEKLQLIDLESEGHLEYVTLTEDNRIFLVTEKENTLFFYEWTEDTLLPQGQFFIPKELRGRITQVEGLFLNEEEFWFKRNKSNFILRINKKTGKVQKITAADFPGNSTDTTLIIDRVTEKQALPGNEFYIYRQVQDRRILYKLNLATDRLEQVEGIPADWNIEKIAIDQVGNKIFLFKDEKGNYKSILQAIDGKQFDYSALFEPLHGIQVSHFQSEDFREKIIICHNRGLLLQQVKTTEAIQYFMPSYQIRDMAELPDHKFIISTHTDGFFLLDLSKEIVEPFRIPGCPFTELPSYTNLTTDPTGNIWYNTHTDFINYNPVNNNCSTIPFAPNYIAYFTFVGPDQIAVFDRQNFLYSYDLKSQQTSPFLVSDKHLRTEARIQDVYYDNKNGLWVATNGGLLKINLKTKVIEIFGHEPPFRDFRMVCIEPDENGRLWLGTSLRGLQIFDPNSGEVSVLNNEQGLSNNTVISILKDNDGDRWLATYNGISIVDQNGQMVANLTEEDGLMEKENNRFSKLKANDGKLLFGTINGLHIIDPQAVKKQLKQTKNLKVYLTSLEYYNPKNKADVQYTNRLNDINALELRASKRYLNLKFALSNYFKPEENQYAYMLKGLDEGWTDLGNQRALSLNNLPAGRYELLVKGSDATGNWSQEPLSISIYAKEFFYKKTWFSFLVFFTLLLFISGISWLWIRRLRTEVKKATSKIRQDKEVIERQAKQLKDIDKAKSIFFTNISHEFRTPLTVISGMAGRLKKHPEERREHSFDMIHRNSNNLLNLVNQILDLRKLESGKLGVDLIQADVIPYLRYIFESFESLAQNKDIRVHLLMDEKELVMDHDKKKLLRIVSNLLSNAIKFTPEGGDVYFMVSNTLGVLKPRGYY